jgi:hypothetical protein
MDEEAAGLAREIGSGPYTVCATCGRPIERGVATTVPSDGPPQYRSVEAELCPTCRDDVARGDADLREPLEEP